MKLIIDYNTDPYFNLAKEEYLMKNFTDDIFMLWRDENCIVVGKNQNTIQEINVSYIKDNDIKVVRRLSGGGAVFHDLGNLNFTFIKQDDGESFNNFERFTQPIIDVLNDLGIKAEFSGRNDITIEGKKFSGNAQYKYKNRVLHHGTLLFASKMADLSAALKPKPSKFKGKSVKSVISRVTNISSHLKEDMTIEDFQNKIMNHMQEQSDFEIYHLTDEDMDAIHALVKDKYATYDWNFGQSPKYDIQREDKFPGGFIEFHCHVEHGTIKAVKFYGDFFSKESLDAFESNLVGLRYNYNSLKDHLEKYDYSNYFSNITVEELLSIMY